MCVRRDVEHRRIVTGEAPDTHVDAYVVMNRVGSASMACTAPRCCSASPGQRRSHSQWVLVRNRKASSSTIPVRYVAYPVNVELSNYDTVLRGIAQFPVRKWIAFGTGCAGSRTRRAFGAPLDRDSSETRGRVVVPLGSFLWGVHGRVFSSCGPRGVLGCVFDLREMVLRDFPEALESYRERYVKTLGRAASRYMRQEMSVHKRCACGEMR